MKPKALSYFLLLLLTAACTGSGERMRMEQALTVADSMNRHYISLSASDTILTETARYFDRHGTTNERLRAHYLLGCAYRDQGDAPQALEVWHHAVDYFPKDKPDSVSYSLIMAVYGQMSELYDAQRLSSYQLEAMKCYEKYAVLAGDTLKYIRNIEMMVNPYEVSGDTVRMLECLQTARQLYERYGYHREAVRTLCTPIYVAIERGQLDSAQNMMRIYETQSGLFKEHGDIKHGREVYYYFKGLLYLKLHQLDSAEFQMRKLMQAGMEINACRGLSLIYAERGQADSVIKYSALFEKAMDRDAVLRERETLQRMSAMYDYGRIATELYDRKQEVDTLRWRVALFVMVFLVASAILVHVIVIHRKRKKKAFDSYMRKVQELRKSREEIRRMEMNEDELKSLVKEKISLIADLENQIKEFQKTSGIVADASSVHSIESTEIYSHFHVLAAQGSSITDEDWHQLKQAFKEYLPSTCQILQQHNGLLNSTEISVYMLSRINIKPTPISNMLGVSAPYITQVRRNLLKVIFKTEGKSSYFDLLIRKIN